MKSIKRIKDQTQTEKKNSVSRKKVVFINRDTKLIDAQPISINEIKDDFQTVQNMSNLSPTQNSADKLTSRRPFTINTALTIIWYSGICILFIIAFFALVLSVYYFLSDSSTEQVVKLYGITGAGCLVIITFLIIFFDCCNDAYREDYEEEAIYRIIQIRDKDLAIRYNRRLAKEQAKKSKYYSELDAERSSPISYRGPFACRICHKSHASDYWRHNRADIGVDTSDKFEPVLKPKKVIEKVTHDAQTEPNFWDTEHGTQTDRTEATQTTAVDLNPVPKNVTEIIHETTIFKAPRNLLPTLKKAMEEQDKNILMNRSVNNIDLVPIEDP